MSDIYLHSRGQVWHWDDPVYGPKRDGYKIEPDEKMCRYSRYVLIIQNVDYSPKTIGVLPLSTVNSNEGDICVKLFDHGPSAYIKIGYPMTVSSSSLKKFVGFVKPQTLEKVDQMIRKFYLPSGGKIEIFDHDVIPELNTNSEKENESERLTTAHDTPLHNDLHEEENEENEDSTSELVNRSKHWSDEQKLEFIKLYKTQGATEAARKYDISISSAKRYWICWRNLSPNEGDPTVETNNIKKGKIEWSLERKREFAEYYKNHGKEETARKYNLKLTSTNKYYSNWKSLI